METSILSLLIAVPGLAGLVLLFGPRSNRLAQQGIALLAAGVTLFLASGMALSFPEHEAGFALIESHAWIPSFGITFKLGLDGISLVLVLLTAFLGPVVVVAAFSQVHERLREYLAAILLLEACVLGVFMALDLFLFYVFWEAMLLPMAVLIGIWGYEHRVYAAVKFLIFTMVGSLLMLLAILYLYSQSHLWTPDGTRTFDLIAIYEGLDQTLLQGGPGLSRFVQRLLFLGFALAFAIKVPMVPFHTWLPDAHVQAPTGGSIVLAGVLLKMGTYGFLRFCVPLFPEATIELAPILGTIAVVGIIYGAFLAWAQKDIKRLVAYSSISHLGFVVLGIFSLSPRGVSGGVFQMLAHGITTGALFLLVGILYERRKKPIAEYGGLFDTAPIFGGVFLVITLASIGLPGLCGFVGEFLILLGTFEAHPILASVAVAGVIFGAIYMLSMFRRVMFGKPTSEEAANVADLRGIEGVVVVPLLLAAIWLGVQPNILLDRIGPPVESILERVERHTGYDVENVAAPPTTDTRVAAGDEGADE